MNKTIIGISGYARSGKDTLASSISENLTLTGVSNKIFSFAFALKSDIDEFCLSKIGISAFTEDSDLKSKIRPILISYGSVQRKMSQGKYWISKLKPEIDSFFDNGGNIAIIPDLRFKEYEFDEYDFIRSYKNNFVATVSRNLQDGTPNPPAHETEEKNFPFFLENSNLNIEWETGINKSIINLNAKKLIGLLSNE